MDYYNQTTLHPLGLSILVILCFALLIFDKDYIAIPFIIISVIIAPAQRITLLGFDLTFLRITILFFIIRVMIRNEFINFKLISLDRAILLWGIFSVTTYTILHGSISAFVNRLGYMVDTVGVYFVFRFLIRGKNDIERFVFYFFIASIPVSIFFILEYITGYNIFSVFGGVPKFTIIREGRLRVQGAFAHPILAGCFWASILPFLIVSMFSKNGKKYFILIFVFLLLILLPASSTPIIGAIAGLSFVVLYRNSNVVRMFPLYFVIIYFFLDLIMDYPVWHILAKIDLSGGSTGWHRYWLVNQTIRYFSQWALVGVKNIDSWNVFGNDITNQYVLEAIRGGIFTLLAFIYVIIIAYITVIRETEIRKKNGNESEALLMWSLGASLTVHVVNFIGVSYFGQIIILQYLILAMIGSMFQYNKEDNKLV